MKILMGIFTVSAPALILSGCISTNSDGVANSSLKNTNVDLDVNETKTVKEKGIYYIYKEIKIPNRKDPTKVPLEVTYQFKGKDVINNHLGKKSKSPQGKYALGDIKDRGCKGDNMSHLVARRFGGSNSKEINFISMLNHRNKEMDTSFEDKVKDAIVTKQCGGNDFIYSAVLQYDGQYVNINGNQEELFPALKQLRPSSISLALGCVNDKMEIEDEEKEENEDYKLLFQVDIVNSIVADCRNTNVLNNYDPEIDYNL